MIARDGFTTEPPGEPGLYLLICDENSKIAEPVAVVTRPMGDLACHCEGYGVCGVEMFHDGLTNPQWRFIA